jgi:hypothetical protein
MEMRVVLAIAAMGVEDNDVAAFELVATDLAKEIIEALDSALHEGAQQDVGVLVECGAQHSGESEDDVTIDDSLMEHRADLADPVIDVDLGTSQAQSRFTAHGDEVFPLPTLQASIFDIAHLFRVPAPKHLFHECIIVSMIITGMSLLKFLPVITKDFLKDIPSWSEL